MRDRALGEENKRGMWRLQAEQNNVRKKEKKTHSNSTIRDFKDLLGLRWLSNGDVAIYEYTQLGALGEVIMPLIIYKGGTSSDSPAKMVA